MAQKRGDEMEEATLGGKKNQFSNILKTFTRKWRKTKKKTWNEDK